MKVNFFYLWGIFLIPLFFSCHKEAEIKRHPRDWNYRSVPSHLGSNPKSEFFILLGDELAYGSGLSDEATMAHLMDQRSFHYKVYNRARPGASALDILESLKNRYYLRGVGEESGVVALVIPHAKLKEYLPLLAKFKVSLEKSRHRLGILCEWPASITGLPSECTGARFEEGVLTEESIKEIYRRF